MSSDGFPLKPTKVKKEWKVSKISSVQSAVVGGSRKTWPWYKTHALKMVSLKPPTPISHGSIDCGKWNPFLHNKKCLTPMAQRSMLSPSKGAGLLTMAHMAVGQK